MNSDFERGYEFFRQWPNDMLLRWARETETGRNAMTMIGRKLNAAATKAEAKRRRKGRIRQ